MHQTIVSWFTGSLFALLFASPTTAEAARGGLQISYRATAGCPTQRDFASSLSARVSRLALTDDPSNWLLSVNIVTTDEGYRGELRLFIEGTLSLERVLADRNCAALTEALALVGAMELRPASSANSRQTTSTAAAAAELHASDVAVTDGARSLEFRAAATVGLHTAPTPAPLLTFGVNGALLTQRGPGHWSFAVLYGQTGFDHYPNGQARFRWLSTRVAACPLGLSEGALVIFPCALGEFGLLRGEARQVVDAANRDGIWFAPGLGLLGSVGLRGLGVEGFVGVVRPIVRDRFLFISSNVEQRVQEVHRAGSVGLVSELRLGWKF